MKFINLPSNRILSCILLCFGMTILILMFYEHSLKVAVINYHSYLIKESLLVDKTPRLSNEEQFEKLQKTAPNLPIEFWLNNRKKNMKLNKTCAQFPYLYNLKFRNTNWQSLLTTNGQYELFGAYLDTRPHNNNNSTVRILGMANEIEPIQPLYCQIWFENNTRPVIVQTVKFNLIWHKGWGNYKKGNFHPYLISCHLPKEHQNNTVAAVSLVENYCDLANNLFKVIYNNVPEKHDFAVCVKGLDFLTEDISSILVEWIELILLLGAHKIFLYNLHVHPNVTKVFDYYENLGKIEVIPLTLPAGHPNLPYLQHLYLENKVLNKFEDEVIPYNDCFYKHMYQYRYIALLDIDEVIIPLRTMTWKELMETVNNQLISKKVYSSFNARNLYYFTDLLYEHNWFKGIPPYMHTLQNVYRNKEYLKAGINIKSFHNTETVLTLHNHYPVSCLGGCKSYGMNPNDALLFHYKRKPEKKYKEIRQNAIVDTTIWKYKEPLIKNVTKALRELKFLRHNS